MTYSTSFSTSKSDAKTGVPYVGRFAPSPTGPLHLGSLVAALGSYLHARAAGGQWLLRIEDVDTERNQEAAEAAILRTLDAYGFEWDGVVLRQTTRFAAYQAALNQLHLAGQAYPCACSRSEIERAATALGLPRAMDGGWVYPGTCREGLGAGREPRAWRFRVAPSGEDEIVFDDALQGRVVQHLAKDVGDFVLKRADGPFAYQLAVVVDDAFQGVTDVVRGADLIDSTPRQIALQRALGVTSPHYCHLPLVLDENGEKLSKQTRATPLDDAYPLPALIEAAAFIGLAPSAFSLSMTLQSFWRMAHAEYKKSKFSTRFSDPGHSR